MTDEEKVEALKEGYSLMSGLVWKFLDMSYLEDEPETQAIIDRADEACR